MDINFPLVLVVLTFGTGLIWLGDRLFFLPKRLAQSESGAAVSGDSSNIDAASFPKEPSIVEMSRSFFPVLALVLVLRSFLVEPFQIPSGSMLPTLEVGDFILVNKFTYGIRLPVLDTKVVSLNDPERGDILVFRFPKDNRTNYIKRVVGVPGDVVRYKDKQLWINGNLLDSKFLGQINNMEMFQEQLVEVNHKIFKNASGFTYPGEEGEWVIPEASYFVMGDNRDNSNDSRFWGVVPDQNIVGKAFAIWMHWETLFSLPSFSRVGSIDKTDS